MLVKKCVERTPWSIARPTLAINEMYNHMYLRPSESSSGASLKELRTEVKIIVNARRSSNAANKTIIIQLFGVLRSPSKG